MNARTHRTPRDEPAVAGESLQVMLRGFDTMRRIQESASRETLARHARAAEQLRRPLDPVQLLQVQGTLMREDFEQFALYWQQLAAAALEMQSQVASCCTRLVDTEALLHAASALEH